MGGDLGDRRLCHFAVDVESMMRISILVAFGLGLSACNRDAATEPGTAPGVYALASINAKALPVSTLDAGGNPTRRFYGRLTLSDDGSYVREQRDSTPQPVGPIAAITNFDYGTWTRRGDSVFLVSTLPMTAVHYPPGRGVATPSAATILFGTDTYSFTTIP